MFSLSKLKKFVINEELWRGNKIIIGFQNDTDFPNSKVELFR